MPHVKAIVVSGLHVVFLGKRRRTLAGVEGESGAGDGNRTHVSSLGSCSSTIELHPRKSANSIRVHDASATVRDRALGSGGVEVQIGARDSSAGGIACRVMRA